MNIDIHETYGIAAEMQAFVQRLEGPVALLVQALKSPPPRNRALIEGQGALVLNEVRWFHGRYPGIVATQSAVQARAEALGRSLGAVRVQMPQDWYDLNTRVNRLRQELNLWHGLFDLLRAQIDPPRRPLYPRRRPQGDPGEAARRADDRLAAQVHRLLNPAAQGQAAQDHGCHEDIPLPSSRFMEHALAARRICLAQRRQAPLRFLDIGCGGGLKVLAALQMFDRADGLEFDAGFVAAGQRLLARAEAARGRIGQADALAFAHYDDYDVLYVFRPMRGEAALEELERRIVAGARPGALIVAPYRGFAARHRALGCAQVAGAVFGVGMTQRAARELRRRAERTGCALEMPKLALRDRWDGLRRASFANGFAETATDWMDEI